MRTCQSPPLCNFFTLAVMVSLIPLAGCGHREPPTDLVSVIGQITLDDRSPGLATVWYYPEKETAEPVKANVSPKGMYSLASKDRLGVLPGRYKVVVETADGAKYTTAVEVVKSAETKRYDLKLNKK